MAAPRAQTQPTAARPMPARDVRFIGDLTGCYTLSSRENAGEDEVRVFACRSRSISPQMAVLQAPLRGAIGEALALRFDALGLIKAVINRHTADGFIVDLRTTESEQAVLAARIDWLKRRALESIEDRRRNKRWMPRDPRSTLILPGKKTLECFVMDISVSGVAISADLMPTIGQPLAVGAVLGRVVRRLDFGFAVQFLLPQDRETVEAHLASVKDGNMDLLAQSLNAAEAALAAQRLALQSTETPSP